MKSFEIKTRTRNGMYIFLTDANNGKAALSNLLRYSGDFKHILGKRESDRMTISVKQI